MRDTSPRELFQQLGGSPLIIMLDIDGTLCDIVERPDDAFVPPNAADALRALNNFRARDVHVALVTGRSVADARRMIGFDGIVIYGNHGSERASRSGTVHKPRNWDAHEESLRTAAAGVAQVAREFPGARLENKQFSLTLHYRDVETSRAAELHQRVAEQARDKGLILADGKCVINIVPEGLYNKGDAVLEVIESVAAGRDMSAASILFAGDDVTDEDAFVALTNYPDAVTVRVGDSDRETAARFALPSPREVHELLDLLRVDRS